MLHIEKRTRVLRKGTTKGEAILYWMIRDKRAVDNWALIAAQDHAIKHKMPLIVCFQYIGNFLDANIRQYKFLFDGLEETLQTLRDHNIPLFILDHTRPFWQHVIVPWKVRMGLLCTDNRIIKRNI